MKVNYLWRRIATVFGFLSFGIGATIITLSVFPLVCLFSRDPSQRRTRVRFLISCLFQFFLNFLSFLGVLKLDIEDMQKVRNLKGVLIICNHPCLLDVLVIISTLRNVQCIVKSALWKNPFVRLIITSAGYIRNDMEPLDFLETCKNDLQSGDNIIIFPEGTRTTPGEPIKLHRSLGNLALAAEADIQALTMDCTPLTLAKEHKWYHIPHKRFVLRLNVGKYFHYSNYGNNDRPRSLRVRALMRDLQDYYTTRIKV